MPAFTEFGRKVMTDPEGAKAEFLRAYEKVRGHRKTLLKELGGHTYSIFYRWVKQLGIDLEALDKSGEQLGWESRRSGGAGYHKNPELRAKRAARTMKKLGIKPGRKPKVRTRSRA